MLIGGLFGKKRHKFDMEPEDYSISNLGSGVGMPGPESMNQQPQPKGPSFMDKGLDFLSGTADTLIQMRGGPPTHSLMKQQRRQQKFAEAQYERKRQDEFADWQKQQEYARQNKAPYRWEANDGSLMEMGPDGLPKVAYKDPTSKPVMQIDPTTGIMRQVQLEQPVPDAEFGGWGDETPPATVGVPAPKLGANGLPDQLTPAQYQAVVQSLGKQKTDAWIKQYNIRVTQ